MCAKLRFAKNPRKHFILENSWGTLKKKYKKGTVFYFNFSNEDISLCNHYRLQEHIFLQYSFITDF